MFAPFVIPSDATVGDMAIVHWGNVDTGAMVNVRIVLYVCVLHMYTALTVEYTEVRCSVSPYA